MFKTETKRNDKTKEVYQMSKSSHSRPPRPGIEREGQVLRVHRMDSCLHRKRSTYTSLNMTSYMNNIKQDVLCILDVAMCTNRVLLPGLLCRIFGFLEIVSL